MADNSIAVREPRTLQSNRRSSPRSTASSGYWTYNGIGDDRFVAPSEPAGVSAHVYGGQLLAQALVAAAATVTGKAPHALHAAFVKAGAAGPSPGAGRRSGARRPFHLDTAGHGARGGPPAARRPRLVSRQRHRARRRRPGSRRARRRKTCPCSSTGRESWFPNSRALWPPLDRTATADRVPHRRAAGLPRRALGEHRTVALDAASTRCRRRPAAAHRAPRLRQRLLPHGHGLPLPSGRSGPGRGRTASASITPSGSIGR